MTIRNIFDFSNTSGNKSRGKLKNDHPVCLSEATSNDKLDDCVGTGGIQ